MGRHSKDKGGNHEREIGRKLSLWLSHGEKTDLFSRNVLSGGSFTHSMNRHGVGKGTAGDLLAAHPLAYEFLQLFEVECKHWEDIQADAILWKMKGQLLNVIDVLEKRALKERRFFMLIARQDYRPDLLMISAYKPFQEFYLSKLNQNYHLLWSNRILACKLEDFFTCNPDEFTVVAAALMNLVRVSNPPSNRLKLNK
jgi:hypothetical protein